jgi:hypothetical protein
MTDLFTEGVFARMLECSRFDRQHMWAYNYHKLQRIMTKRGVFDNLVKCMQQNIPNHRSQGLPSSYVSYNSTMHTFVDGDDHDGDEPNVHRGGNFGFLVSVPGKIVTCSYIADASTTAINRPCTSSGEKYRVAYIKALESYCRPGGAVRDLHVLQRCCHSNLSVMLDHHAEIKRRCVGRNRCFRGMADSMNQVHIVFSVAQIKAVFLRHNHIGFAKPWRRVLPEAFAKATGRRVPLVEF